MGIAAAALVVVGAPTLAHATTPTSAIRFFGHNYGPVIASSTTPSSHTFILTNPGGKATGLITIHLTSTGGASNAFAITANTCTGKSLGGLTKSAPKMCGVTVLYDPTVVDGSDTATLTATSPRSTTSVSLIGDSILNYTVCVSGCAYSNLQDAINDVEAGAIANPITVGPGTYNNSNNGAFVVTGTVDIEGVGSDPSTGTVLDGQNDGSVIFVNAGSLTISGVDITNGASGVFGGGINNVGALTIDGDVMIANNTAQVDGGGIANLGVLDFDAVSNVLISDNSAPESGGIFNDNSVFFEAGSYAVITGNTGTFAAAFNNDGGEVIFDAGSTVIITDNTYGGYTDEIHTMTYNTTFEPGSSVTITGNTPFDCAVFSPSVCP